MAFSPAIRNFSFRYNDPNGQGVVADFADSPVDVIIIQPGSTLANATDDILTVQEVNQIRSGADIDHVIAYFPFGRAENNKDFFDTIPASARYTGGNLEQLKFWEPAVLNVFETYYRERLNPAGFDGLFLDDFGGYFFAYQELFPGDIRMAARKAVDAVIAFNTMVDTVSGRDIKIILNNGLEVLHHLLQPGQLGATDPGDLQRANNFRAAVDGLAFESQFIPTPGYSYGRTAIANGYRDFVTNSNTPATMLAIDYNVSPAAQFAYYAEAARAGLLAYGSPNAPNDSFAVDHTPISVATAEADVIVSTASQPVSGLDGNDLLIGRGGADTLNGNSGNDTVEAAAGTDRLFGDAGDDQLFGGDGNDLASGGIGSDYLDGQGENDALYGGDNNDTVVGNIGDDYLDGQGENDQLYGNDGRDIMVGNLGNDYLDGGDGRDELYGNDNNDILIGNLGNDYLDGQGETDTLYGSAGNDTLYGNLGNDQIWGGIDTDSLIGDLGDDQFRFAPGDLQAGVRDVIADFAEAGGNADLLVFFGVAAGAVTTTAAGGGTLVSIAVAGGNAEILLQGFLPAQLADQIYFL